MASRTETTLLTVEAPYKRLWRDRTFCRTPRVVGIDIDDGILWSPTSIPDRPDFRFEKGKTQEIAIPSDPLFHERLVGFFATYLAQESDGHKKDYNCHTFGRYMIGATLPYPEMNLLGPVEFVTAGEKADTVSWGQRGVIGFWWHEDRASAVHSLVGLGDESCIQVDGYRGLMRITSVDEALVKYADAHSDASLYVETEQAAT